MEPLPQKEPMYLYSFCLIMIPALASNFCLPSQKEKENDTHAALEQGKEPTFIRKNKNRFDMTPIFYAVEEDTDSISTLIADGADINEKDDTGFTPLMHLCFSWELIFPSENEKFLHHTRKVLSYLPNPFLKDNQARRAIDYLFQPPPHSARFLATQKIMQEYMKEYAELYSLAKQSLDAAVLHEQQQIEAKAQKQNREQDIVRIPESSGIRALLAEYLLGETQPMNEKEKKK